LNQSKDSGDEPVFLDKKQLARKLNIGVRTVERWMSNQLIPYLRVGNKVLFDLQRVIDALKRFEVKEKRSR